jgi:hypothetical protein
MVVVILTGEPTELPLVVVTTLRSLVVQGTRGAADFAATAGAGAGAGLGVVVGVVAGVATGAVVGTGAWVLGAVVDGGTANVTGGGADLFDELCVLRCTT